MMSYTNAATAGSDHPQMHHEVSEQQIELDKKQIYK